MMNKAHQRVTTKAWKRGWALYRGHQVVGDVGRWTVLAGGEKLFQAASVGECLRAIDEVVDEQ